MENCHICDGTGKINTEVCGACFKAADPAQALQRIRQRQTKKDEWKWQLIDTILKLRKDVQELRQEVSKLADRDETRRRLSEAGKKSAAARKAKFGNAKPGQSSSPAPILSVVQPVQIPIDIGCDKTSEPLREPVRKKKTKSDEPTPGSLVWDDYREAFLERHHAEPLRNAKVNKFCSTLVDQIGAGRAREIVRYYISRNDALYLKAKHPLGILLVDLQKLNTEFQTGQEMTGKEAMRAENAAVNDRVVRQYAATQDSFSEPVHELVR